ncbi:MAG: ADP-heptose--LPS heptosyltransferase [Caulobacter vibrioides]|uniref:ADP-heptose--LPS heptosyltransferase n=1 Tax=Caulobacter vibrioides TaxID=155892 RepID=A0A258D974_CAUVI|nr:MAG: ADP-heptose--LPS heptosyltransferase [Caulobacter vibrioides]
MASPSFPILVVAPERVDDAILASGLIRTLADEVSHSSFTVAAGAEAAPLFRDIPGLDRIIPFEAGRGALHWFGLWRQVRRRRWGLVLDMRGSRLARFLHARRRGVRKPLNPALEPVHKVVEAARVLRIDDVPPAPFLFVSDETQAKADALLKGEGPILAVSPAADWVGKTWPAERFAIAVAELLAPGGPLPGGRLLLLGKNEDRWATETVRRVTARGRMIDLVGKVDLLTAYACLKRARLFIGNETPFMHLAAAAGAPTLGLFGPSDERLYAPWGERAVALRGPRSFEQFKALDPTFSLAVNHMQDLTTAKVVAAARTLLDATADIDKDDHG